MLSSLSDIEFQRLLDLQKRFDNLKRIVLPVAGKSVRFDIVCEEPDAQFILDFDRSGRIELKHKTQLRYHTAVVLVRIDINAPPHMNPDDQLIGRNHIHLYREGYDDKWAYDISSVIPRYHDGVTVTEIFQLFCAYCRIELTGTEIQGVF
jgi:hypothetical protein